ncbi:hypothetical protein ACFQ0B_61240 [Nonomuraea thailandensis]
MTRTRSWTVDTAVTTPPDGLEPAFVSSTPTDRPSAATTSCTSRPPTPRPPSPRSPGP